MSVKDSILRRTLSKHWGAIVTKLNLIAVRVAWRVKAKSKTVILRIWAT